MDTSVTGARCLRATELGSHPARRVPFGCEHRLKVCNVDVSDTTDERDQPNR